MNSPKGNSDFFNSIVEQMRRIDEEFFIEMSEETPLQQVLNSLKKAIDVLEEQKTSQNFFNNESNLFYRNEKLQEYEKLLKSRDKRIKTEENLIFKEKQLLFAEKEKIKKIKDHHLIVESELKAQKLNLEQKEKEDITKTALIREKFEQELKNINDQKKALENEFLEIEKIKIKLEEYNKTLDCEREEFELEKLKLFEQSLENDKENWKIDNEKADLQEKITINNHLIEKINQELENLKAERADILKAKIDFQSEILKHAEHLKIFGNKDLFNEDILIEKQILLDDRKKLREEEEKIVKILLEIENERQRLVNDQNLINEHKQSEKCGKIEKLKKTEDFEQLERLENIKKNWKNVQTKPIKSPEYYTNKYEENYSAILEELQTQMTNYNKELEIREQEIEKKEILLEKRKNDLEKKWIEIQNVESNLFKAVKELEKLSIGTIPELESYSLQIRSVLTGLLIKKSEVQSGYDSLQSKINQFNDDFEYKNREKKLNAENKPGIEKQKINENSLVLQRPGKEIDSSCIKKIEETIEKNEKFDGFSKKIEKTNFLKENLSIDTKDLRPKKYDLKIQLPNDYN